MYTHKAVSAGLVVLSKYSSNWCTINTPGCKCQYMQPRQAFVVLLLLFGLNSCRLQTRRGKSSCLCWNYGIIAPALNSWCLRLAERFVPLLPSIPVIRWVATTYRVGSGGLIWICAAAAQEPAVTCGRLSATMPAMSVAPCHLALLVFRFRHL